MNQEKKEKELNEYVKDKWIGKYHTAKNKEYAAKVAAEKVLGWKLVKIGPPYYIGEDSQNVYDYKWKPYSNRNQLAKVFKKAWEILNGKDAPGWTNYDERVVNDWNGAVHDWWSSPTDSLFALLDLLNIPFEPEKE